MKKLFHGKDSFLSLREAKRVIKEIPQKETLFEYTIIDAANSTCETVINQLSSNDIFDKPKILLIKRIFGSKNKENIVNFLLKHFDTLSDLNHYIFWEDSKISSITKYYKLFKKEVLEFDEIKKQSFAKWAMEEINQLGMISDRTVILKLSQKVDFNSQVFLNEIEKLTVLGVKKITEEDITETTNSYSYDIWKLISAINLKDRKMAIEIYNNLTNHQVDPSFIQAMLIRSIRLLTQVKYLKDKDMPSSQICSLLGIAPFTLPELVNSSRETDWEKIKYIYEKLASLDFEIKKGTIDIDLGLTLLLTKI